MCNLRQIRDAIADSYHTDGVRPYDIDRFVGDYDCTMVYTVQRRRYKLPAYVSSSCEFQFRVEVTSRPA